MKFLRKSRGYDTDSYQVEGVHKSNLSEKQLLSFMKMVADGMTHIADSNVSTLHYSSHYFPIDCNFCLWMVLRKSFSVETFEAKDMYRHLISSESNRYMIRGNVMSELMRHK